MTEHLNEEVPIFSPITLPQRHVSPGEDNVTTGYRIYGLDGTREVVQAETVTEALEKATITKPSRIEKIGFERFSVYSPKDIIAKEVSAEPAAPQEGNEEKEKETVDSTEESGNNEETTQEDASPDEGQPEETS